MQVRLFYGLQVIEINQLIHCISYKVYYVNFRETKKLFGGVLKSMLTLNEAIIDVKEG